MTQFMLSYNATYRMYHLSDLQQYGGDAASPADCFMGDLTLNVENYRFTSFDKK